MHPIPRDRVRLPAFLAYLPPGAAATRNLLPRRCRWPLGDVAAEEFRFCLEPCGRGPYCPAHRRLALRGRS
jgi:hypothetical protein